MTHEIPNHGGHWSNVATALVLVCERDIELLDFVTDLENDHEDEDEGDNDEGLVFDKVLEGVPV